MKKGAPLEDISGIAAMEKEKLDQAFNR